MLLEELADVEPGEHRHHQEHQNGDGEGEFGLQSHRNVRVKHKTTGSNWCKATVGLIWIYLASGFSPVKDGGTRFISTSWTSSQQRA